MTDINTAKTALLDALIKTSEADLGSNALAFAEAFAVLTNAENQVRMTDWQTAPCTCEGCRGDLNDEVIN